MNAIAQGAAAPAASSAVEVDNDAQLYLKLNRLLVRRTQVVLAITIGGMGLFSVADLWRQTPGRSTLFVLRAVTLGLIASAYALLRQPRCLPYATLISWLVFVIGSMLIALAGIVSHAAYSTSPILCVLVTFVAGALFPWGAGVQLSATVVAVGALCLSFYWTGTTGLSSISYQGAGGVAACVIFMVGAAGAVRRRILTLFRDNLHRQYAEEELRRSNQHLEERVRHRIAELEAAKTELTRQINENQRLGHSLRESEHLLRSLIDNSNSLIQLKDMDGRYLLTNAQHARRCGYPRDAAVGKTPYDLLPETVAASIVAHDGQVLDANRPLQFEETLTEPDGQHTYLSIRFPVRAPGGVPYGVCGISTDITERKRIEGALRRSQSTLSALINCSDEGIWAIDGNYRILLLNAVVRQRHSRIFGVEPQVGMDFRAALPAAMLTQWETFYRRALSGEHFAVEYAAISVQGKTWHFLASANPVIDATGIIGATVFIKDIGDLKRAEEQKQQRQAELAKVLQRSTLGVLAAELTHEINQPLAVIANYAQGCRRRLQSGALDTTDLGQAIDHILREAQRAAKIVERLQSAVLNQPVRDEAIDVNQLVRDALHAVEYRTTGLAIEMALADDLPQIHGDAVQIEQVVLNLLHNAIDALQAVPRERRQLIVETCFPEHGVIEIAVHDRGAGLERSIADKLFQPFVTTKTDGLGMGLAICRTIVEAHRGRLWATPNPKGGCTFRLALPLAGASGDAGVSRAEPQQ